KAAFFSNVSHEFRTPLALMLGLVEEVRSNAALPTHALDRLAMAHRNGLRLLKLVNSLLDFSRIEAGRVPVNYAPTDLGTLTAELANSFLPACEKASLRLILNCSPSPAPLYVDREMWAKIVLNLVSNAFKFTFHGEIEVMVRSIGAVCEVSVRDTGVGIPPAELPHIFERFYRVESTRGRTLEGTGIGLSLA